MQIATARRAEHSDHQCSALCQQYTTPWKHHWLCTECWCLCKVWISINIQHCFYRPFCL